MQRFSPPVFLGFQPAAVELSLRHFQGVLYFGAVERVWAKAFGANQAVASLSYSDVICKMKGVIDHPDHV